jgi:small conductance mechanosensitive channel
MDFEQILTSLQPYGIILIKVVLAYMIGMWLIGKITTVVGKMANKSTGDKTLNSFLTSMVSMSLKVVLFIAIAGMMGIETTSFMAIVASAGLAVGLALQGSLSNFAGGVMILIFRPIKVGELIEAEGHMGFVKEVDLFVTTIVTPDNRLVIIPNGTLSNGIINNYSRQGKIRIDLVLGVAYDSDIKKAREVIVKSMQDNPNVLSEPAPEIHVVELADNSVNFSVRPWTTADKYWAVYLSTLERAKYALDEAGIEIPFPQRVVHLQNTPPTV